MEAPLKKKATRLWANSDFDHKVYRKLEPGAVQKSGIVSTTRIDSAGKSVVDGGPHLRLTQAYPAEFARAVAYHYVHRAKPDAQLPFEDLTVCDVWAGARLTEALLKLGK